MIIQCINCNKNFEVNPSLIPEIGRNIQCGSCDHIWFYKHNNNVFSSRDQNINKKENQKTTNKIKDEKIIFNQETRENVDSIDIKKNLSKQSKSIDSSKIDKANSLGLSKILSYFLVGIITFIALIIFLDTFKSSLNNLFPRLELLLYNLFESIKDIFLFFKNLLM
jgi:predicted Zn finger-like uncharacterized protein